jgi:hypothetical protein
MKQRAGKSDDNTRLSTPKAEYDSDTSSDACQLERNQWNFVSLCYHHFYSHLYYSYGNVKII